MTRSTQNDYSIRMTGQFNTFQQQLKENDTPSSASDGDKGLYTCDIATSSAHAHADLVCSAKLSNNCCDSKGKLSMLFAARKLNT